MTKRLYSSTLTQGQPECKLTGSPSTVSGQNDMERMLRNKDCSNPAASRDNGLAGQSITALCTMPTPFLA